MYGLDFMNVVFIYGGVFGVVVGIGMFGFGVVVDCVCSCYLNFDSWLLVLGMLFCVFLMIFGYNMVGFLFGVIVIWLVILVFVVVVILCYFYLVLMFVVI